MSTDIQDTTREVSEYPVVHMQLQHRKCIYTDSPVWYCHDCQKSYMGQKQARTHLLKIHHMTKEAMDIYVTMLLTGYYHRRGFV